MDSEFSEIALCELADFIYFCLLILLNLCDSSTLSWETTHLKLISTAAEEVTASIDGIFNEYFQAASLKAHHVVEGEGGFK